MLKEISNSIYFLFTIIAIICVVIVAYSFSKSIFIPPISTIYTTSTITPRNFTTAYSIKHVIIIVLENKEYSGIIGNPVAPYENSLANTYALTTNYFAIAHPSEPNYIAMIAGSTLNITNDGSVFQNQKASTNIVDLFKANGISWKAYEESMPVPCDTSNSADGLYVTKHDPFVYMTNVTNNLTYCSNHIVNLTQFYTDLANDQLPQYSFIAPNMKDDSHSTNISFADSWLSNFLPKIITSSSFNSSVIFLTYDEGTTNVGGGGHVVTIIIGPSSIVKSSSEINGTYSHYSLLATIEAIYRTGNLGRNDANANVMKNAFVTSNSTPT